MVIEGRQGVIRVDASIAYRLGGWSIHFSPILSCEPVMKVTANVEHRDLFWSTQGPMELCVEMGVNVWWCWQRASVAGNGGTVYITVEGTPTIREYLR